MSNLDRIIKNFILTEGGSKNTDIRAYIQALSETLSQLSPRTLRDSNRVKIAKVQLSEIKKHVRKLEEQVVVLQEKVSLLEEAKEG
jgi:hypothetical protein